MFGDKPASRRHAFIRNQRQRCTGETIRDPHQRSKQTVMEGARNTHNYKHETGRLVRDKEAIGK